MSNCLIAENDPAPVPADRWSLVAAALGALLLCTAILKAFAPAEGDALEAAYQLPGWLTAAAIQCELAVGCWLLSGWKPSGARRSVIALLLAFSAFSLYRAVAGYETCGCFGRFSVDPRLTFVLDVGTILMLWLVRPLPASEAANTRSAAGFWTPLLAATYVVLVGFLFWRTTIASGAEQIRPGVSYSDSLVILEPEKWIGRQFPLVDDISPALDIADGRTLILFYHHDCPKCQEALPRIESLRSLRGDRQIALVEIPPFEPLAPDDLLTARYELNPTKEWFIQTPVVLETENGIVKAVTTSVETIF